MKYLKSPMFKVPANRAFSRTILAASAAAVLAFTPAERAVAQNFREWTGTGTGWNDNANWAGGTYTYAQLEWKGNGNATSTANFGSTQSQWRYFFSGSKAYTLSGDQVNLFDNASIRGGILSDSTVQQTINMNMSLRQTAAASPMFILTRQSGALTFGGSVEVTNNATSLGIGGLNTSSLLSFNGVIGGSSSNAIVIGTNALSDNTTDAGNTRVVFAGNNTYSGETRINAGVLTISHANGLGATSLGTAVTNGASLRLSNGITVAGEALSLNGNGISDGGALLSSSGSNAYTGLITLQSTSYVGATNSAQLTISNVAGADKELWVVGAGTTTLAGGATNSGSGTAFVKTNTGTAVLMVSNKWDGAEYIREGTVVLSNNNALGSAGTTFLGAASGTAASTLQIGLGITNSNAITVVDVGTGVRTISYATNTGTGAQLGDITINTNSLALNVANGGTMRLGGKVTVNTGAGDANRLALDGGGTLIVTNDGVSLPTTDRFQVRIGNGTMIIGAGTLIARTNVTGLGHAIDLGVDLSGNIVDNASSLFASNGVTISNSIYSSTTNAKARVIGMQDQASPSTATFSGPIGLSATTLTAQAGTLATVTISGAITNFSGTNGLTKTGAGEVILSASNTYTGGTTLSAGALLVGNNDALGTGGFTINAGTFASDSGTARTITNAITMGGNVQFGAPLGTGALTFTNNNINLGAATRTFTVINTTTFWGGITNTGGLTKEGAGTLNLYASNSYDGVTTVKAGLLRAAAPTSLGSTVGGTVVEAGGQLRLEAVTIGNEALTISGTGTGISDGALRAGSGTSTFGGKVTLGADARVFAGGGLGLIFDVTTNEAIDLGANTLTFVNAGTIAVNDAIVGTGGIIKTNSGTLTMSASNSYIGATDIRSGRLTLSGNGRLGSGAITISNINAGTLELAVTGTNVMANNISGDGVLVSSAGETRLTASNNFTGATAVTGGVLNLNSSAGSSLGSTASVSVTNATLLVSQSNQVNDSAAVTLSGGTIAKGSGAISETFGGLALSANSTLDFGSGTGNFTFATYNPSTFVLKFDNFNVGNSLTVTTGTFSASEFNFNSFGYSQTASPVGGFTITAIPEPSTVAAAIGLVGVLLWPARRRLVRDARSILGLRAPMRDRLASRHDHV
jgi:autotransporter-associated beta strand protein